jgi:hypothetical protein
MANDRIEKFQRVTKQLHADYVIESAHQFEQIIDHLIAEVGRVPEPTDEGLIASAVDKFALVPDAEKPA